MVLLLDLTGFAVWGHFPISVAIRPDRSLLTMLAYFSIMVALITTIVVHFPKRFAFI